VKPVALILLACLALCGLAVDSSFAQTDDDKRIKQLENERKKLSSTKDPADRAESLMKIADITLTYVGDAVAANDLGKLRSSVEEYRRSVMDARDTMIASRLDPYKKPKGYQAVELGVRKQVRILEDASRRLRPDDRQPVDEAMDTVSKIRDEFIRILFP
jgi:hypothetical protein